MNYYIKLNLKLFSRKSKYNVYVSLLTFLFAFYLSPSISLLSKLFKVQKVKIYPDLKIFEEHLNKNNFIFENSNSLADKYKIYPSLYNVNYIIPEKSKNYNNLGTLIYYLCDDCKVIQPNIYKILKCKRCLRLFNYNLHTKILKIPHFTTQLIYELNNVYKTSDYADPLILLALVYFFSTELTSFLKEDAVLKYVEPIMKINFFLFFDTIFTSTIIFLIYSNLILVSKYLHKLSFIKFLQIKGFEITDPNFKAVIDSKFNNQYSFKSNVLLFLYCFLLYNVSVYLQWILKDTSWLITALPSIIGYKLNEVIIDYCIFYNFKYYFMFYTDNFFSNLLQKIKFLKSNTYIPENMLYLEKIQEFQYKLKYLSYNKIIIKDYTYNNDLIFLILCFLIILCIINIFYTPILE